MEGACCPDVLYWFKLLLKCFNRCVFASPTCFQAAPVNLFEEGLILELLAVVIFEPEAFRRVLVHQAFANILALFAEGWCI